MKISIIIPIYNAEKYLRECLDSVIAQTVAEKEAICIDDGSTDGSYAILQEYQEQYPFVRVFRQDNKGAGAARNLGLEVASGEYVSFLDADDFYLDTGALEKLVRACESRKLPCCAGLRKYYYEDGSVEDFPLYRECFENGLNEDGLLFCFREHQDEYFYQNYIFLMDVIRENGICFPDYRRYQDAVFFLRYMVSIDKYLVMPVELYGYRFYGATMKRKESYTADILKGIRDNAELAHKNDLDKLKMILVHRIVDEYSEGIVKNASREILELLCEIQGMLFDRAPVSDEERTSEMSLGIIMSVVEGNVEGFGLDRYLEKEGITACTVYGLGNFGRMTVRELRKSDKLTVYGVDKKNMELEGIKVVPLEEANKKCRHIIVTPVKDNEKLVKDIKAVWKGTVWGLYELLCSSEQSV